MDYGDSTPIFYFADNLGRAKLRTVFVVHGVILVLFFLMSRFHPESTLGRVRVIASKGILWIVLAVLLAALIAIANILVGRSSGATTLLMFNAGVVTLYVVEFAILLSHGFFKRLLGESTLLPGCSRHARCVRSCLNAQIYQLTKRHFGRDLMSRYLMF